MPGYLNISMMSPDLKDAMPCIDTCWKRIILLIGKIHLLSPIIKNKEVLQIVESAPISKLPKFNLSSGFYSLPSNIAQNILSELHLQ